MFVLINTLKRLELLQRFIGDALYRLGSLSHRNATRTDDLRERVVGAALNATAETLAVLGQEKSKLYAVVHGQKVEKIGEDLKLAMRQAHAVHSDALKRLGESTDKQFTKIEQQCEKLRNKRSALRNLL